MTTRMRAEINVMMTCAVAYCLSAVCRVPNNLFNEAILIASVIFDMKWTWRGSAYGLRPGGKLTRLEKDEKNTLTLTPSLCDIKWPIMLLWYWGNSLHGVNYNYNPLQYYKHSVAKYIAMKLKYIIFYRYLIYTINFYKFLLLMYIFYK